MNNESRRNTLKALAMGAPAVWAKPVVDSIVLPVHAFTSGEMYTIDALFDEDSAFNTEQSAFDSPTLTERALYSLIPQANANHSISQTSRFIICANIQGSTFTISVHRILTGEVDCGPINVLYSGGGTLGVESDPLTVVKSCNRQEEEVQPEVTILLDNLVQGVSVDISLTDTDCEDCPVELTLTPDSCSVVEFSACGDCPL